MFIQCRDGILDGTHPCTQEEATQVLTVLFIGNFICTVPSKNVPGNKEKIYECVPLLYCPLVFKDVYLILRVHVDISNRLANSFVGFSVITVTVSLAN